MKLRLVYIFILAEVVVVSALILKIYKNKKGQTLGEIQIAPIEKDNLEFLEEEDIKNFFEPKENTIQEDPRSWLPHQATYTYNADGLNERFDYQVEKGPDIYRIMAIGDSHTHGLFVDTKDNYPEQLEDLLNSSGNCSPKVKNFEVINLGVFGYDIEFTVHRFEKRGLKYQPDLVLWYLKEDDFNQAFDLILSKTEELKKKLSPIEKEMESGEKNLRPLLDQLPQLTDAEKDRFSEYFQWDITHYHPFGIIADKEILFEYGEDRIMAKQKTSLERFFNLFQGKTVLITYSNLEERAKKFLNQILLGKESVYLFDKLSFGDIDRLPDTHPSAKGYEFLSKELFRYLVEEKIIPCLQ